MISAGLDLYSIMACYFSSDVLQDVNYDLHPVALFFIRSGK